jgi:GNAT superfamily N-acetyltransferase
MSAADAVSTAPDVALSPLDEERFGVRTARSASVTVASLPAVLAFCRASDVRMLIARCDGDDFAAAQALEESGGRLMDVLVYYERDLDAPLPEDAARCTIDHAGADDAGEVGRVAREAFVGYRGHYHADPRLDRASATEAYASWAERSCSVPGVADTVLVARIDGAIAGFSTIRFNSEQEGEVVLNAVAPALQRRGIYRSLILRSMAWLREQGRTRFVISTHLSNVAVRRVWAQYGLVPTHSHFTFHLWFDA